MAWYDPDPHVRRRATFGAGALTGALALAIVWVAWALLDVAGLSPSMADASDRPPVRGAPASDLGAAAASTTTLESCRTVFGKQTAALKVAARSLAGWRVHVDAMNQLVAGEVTREQFNDFWESTRGPATGLLAQHAKVDNAYHRRTTRCPRPLLGVAPGEPAMSCAQAVASRGLALRRAGIALTTWREHAGHMEMLRAGTTSLDGETARWLQSRSTVVREIRAYDAAARESRGLAC